VRGGRSGGTKRTALVLALVGALALSASSAWAGGSGIITATDNEFDLDSYPIDITRVANLVNDGDNTHNVTADDEGPDGKALFRTGNVSGGDSRAVNGTQFLENGEYGFRCTIHPDTMQATLEITGAVGSDPLPRPAIEVKVQSKKLEKVVDSRKLKVEVSAAEPTDAEGISLQAKKGKKTITKKKRLDLGAGNSETAKLKLKKNAAEKLADLAKAKVKVSGGVDFGSPAKDSRKLK
jgi:plastocyanin